MSFFFLESSAVVKRHISEIGSRWIINLSSPAAGHVIHVSRLAGVEVTAAIRRRERGGSISPADAATMQTQFRHDFDHQYWILEITPELLDNAMSLAQKHALSGYDAVQLAAALQVRILADAMGLALIFVCADAELNAAALAEGLLVENPNAHP